MVVAPASVRQGETPVFWRGNARDGGNDGRRCGGNNVASDDGGWLMATIGDGSNDDGDRVGLNRSRDSCSPLLSVCVVRDGRELLLL